MYENGHTNFRVASKPAAEARMWMIAGIAGGIQPWWHHVGAYEEDRRAYATADPVMKRHKANEAYLVDRRPVASVGMLWSQRNTDFYGRDNTGELVDAPSDGFRQALIRGRIPYLPVHADDLDRDGAGLSVLILANVGGLSDDQCAAIRRYVARGGSLIATGESTLYNEWGDARPDFALADLLQVHVTGKPVRAPEPGAGGGRRGGPVSSNSYLRLHPELRGRVNGPRNGKEPAIVGERHPVLQGFDETDIIPFGGTLQPLKVDDGVVVPLTFVPEFPAFPPETAWMRVADSGIAGLAVGETPAGARVAYLAADLDRRYFRELLPDHANLLVNLVRWAAKDSIPLSVRGTGLIDCHLYQQPRRMILHLVNLTSAGTWRSPVDELIPIGPVQIRIKLSAGVSGRTAKRLVTSGAESVTVRQGWAELEVKSILDHEVLVIA